MTALGEVVFDAADIARAVDEIAARVQRDYGDEPLHAIVVLKGAAMFGADLVRALWRSALTIDYVAVASYGAGRDGERATPVRLSKDVEIDPAGRNVLLVEDIVDEGVTLKFLLDHVGRLGPKTLRSCALVDKPFHRRDAVTLDYVGLTGPDAFLVGYGLDHQERFRNLPFICKLQTPR